MKFIVSSSELLSHLQAVNKVISNKNSLPILDNFLFKLENEILVITASDLETTLTTEIHDVSMVEEEGVIAIESKRLLDTLKSFPEQPLTFTMGEADTSMTIFSENGEFNFTTYPAEDFPLPPEIKTEETKDITLNSSILLEGINKTLFATGDDELRPVMNGIFMEIFPEYMNFVASDAHKLVRYRRNDAKTGIEDNFILPKKPASLLKNILPKDAEAISIKFDKRNAFFSFGKYHLICRLVEGDFPNYSAVIPTANPNKMTINRMDFANSLRRVAVFSNQASLLVKLDIKEEQLKIEAQDIDFNVSAYENLSCDYQGEAIEIGFKASFLSDILSNINSADIIVELSDPSRAGVLIPYDKEVEEEDLLMLLMPMMINV